MVEPLDSDTAIARYNALVERTNALIAEANEQLAAQPQRIVDIIFETMRQARRARRPKADE